MERRGKSALAEGMARHRLCGGQWHDECVEMTEPGRLGAHGVSRRCGGLSVRGLGGLAEGFFLEAKSWRLQVNAPFGR